MDGDTANKTDGMQAGECAKEKSNRKVGAGETGRGQAEVNVWS